MSAERKRGEPDLGTISRIAKETTLANGFHIPTVIVVGSNQLDIIQIPFDGVEAEARQSLMKVIGMDMATQKGMGELRKLFLVTEGWLARPENPKGEFVPPSEDLNRVEALIVAMLDVQSGLAEMDLFKMRRGQDGELAELVSIKLGGDDGQTRAYLLEKFAEGYQSVRAYRKSRRRQNGGQKSR